MCIVDVRHCPVSSFKEEKQQGENEEISMLIYSCKKTHLSSAIATKWRMLAVQHSTSLLVHISQSSGPSFHSLDISYTADSGMTRHATSRSATARERI